MTKHGFLTTQNAQFFSINPVEMRSWSYIFEAIDSPGPV